MNDRESRDAIIELTDEVESWQQKLLDERKAHDATLADLRSELAATREARDEWERRAHEVLVERDQLRESKRGLAELLDEWQGEAERIDGMLRRERDLYSASLERAEAVIGFWEAEVERYRDVAPVPPVAAPIEWWHAHRRTTR